MKNSISYSRCLWVVFALMLAPSAHAYIGPGAGLGAIGTLLAFFGAIILAIVGFIWYPIKRLLRKSKSHKAKSAARSEPHEDAPAEGEEGEPYSQ